MKAGPSQLSDLSFRTTWVIAAACRHWLSWSARGTAGALAVHGTAWPGPPVGAPTSVIQIGMAASPFAVIIDRMLGLVSAIWDQADHGSYWSGKAGNEYGW